MSIIKLRTAPGEGKKVAMEYKEKHKGKTVKMLLEELSTPPKPPTPPPPPPVKKIEVRYGYSLSANHVCVLCSYGSEFLRKDLSFRKAPDQTDPSYVSEEELQAEKYLKSGDIDQAIAAYQHIQSKSARILKIIARLFADEKHDYETAIDYYQQALKIEKEVRSLPVVSLF